MTEALTEREGWHAPGLGEIHNHDHSSMIYCTKPAMQDGYEIEVPDDALAVRVCAALSAPSVRPLSDELARQLFEDWHTENISGSAVFVERDHEGRYLEDRTHRAWQGFEAARALLAHPSGSDEALLRQASQTMGSSVIEDAMNANGIAWAVSRWQAEVSQRQRAISTLSALLAEPETDDARDAKRYRWLRNRTSGQINQSNHQYFEFPKRPKLSPLGNLMRGSVAGHLDAAIDAAIASRGTTP